jgi:hypothetical protein
MPADITKFTSHDPDGELMKRLTTYAQLKQDICVHTRVLKSNHTFFAINIFYEKIANY